MFVKYKFESRHRYIRASIVDGVSETFSEPGAEEGFAIIHSGKTRIVTRDSVKTIIDRLEAKSEDREA